MAKWLRREHSDAEKYNGLRFFLTENSYNSQKMADSEDQFSFPFGYGRLCI